jgi:hypothetical protein
MPASLRTLTTDPVPTSLDLKRHIPPILPLSRSRWSRRISARTDSLVLQNCLGARDLSTSARNGCGSAMLLVLIVRMNG